MQIYMIVSNVIQFCAIFLLLLQVLLVAPVEADAHHQRQLLRHNNDEDRQGFESNAQKEREESARDCAVPLQQGQLLLVYTYCNTCTKKATPRSRRAFDIFLLLGKAHQAGGKDRDEAAAAAGDYLLQLDNNPAAVNPLCLAKVSRTARVK